MNTMWSLSVKALVIWGLYCTIREFMDSDQSIYFVSEMMRILDVAEQSRQADGNM